MSNKYDDEIAKVWERSHFERATKLLERVETAALYAKERNMPDTLRVLRAAIEEDQRLDAQRGQRIRSIMHQPVEPQKATNERMSDDTKEMARRLREIVTDFREDEPELDRAADALEAMAEKLQRETKAAGYWMERFCASENERDQMLIDLEEYRRDVAKLTEERDRLKAALEGREWERLGNEKVGTHGTPELDEDARKLEAMGQDPGMTLEELLAPATDPAPAVCVWSKNGGRTVSTCMPNGITKWLWNERNQEKCINCLKPIKFAAEPAPVCEWTRTPYTALYSSCCDEDYLRNVTDSGMCHRCGLPIKFAEVKE